MPDPRYSQGRSSDGRPAITDTKTGRILVVAEQAGFPEVLALISHANYGADRDQKVPLPEGAASSLPFARTLTWRCLYDEKAEYLARGLQHKSPECPATQDERHHNPGCPLDPANAEKAASAMKAVDDVLKTAAAMWDVTNVSLACRCPAKTCTCAWLDCDAGGAADDTFVQSAQRAIDHALKTGHETEVSSNRVQRFRRKS